MQDDLYNVSGIHSSGRMRWRNVSVVLIGMLLFGSLCGGATKAQPESLFTVIQKAERAGASGELVRTVADRGREAGFSSEATTRLLRPILELAEEGYPTQSVLMRALEGISKQVPPPRLQTALGDMQGRTAQAGALASGWLRGREGLDTEHDARRALVEHVARAQKNGFSPSTLEQVWSGLHTNTKGPAPTLSAIATAFEVLPELPGSENSPSIAGRLLGRAIDAGYSTAELRQLPSALRPEGTRQLPHTAITRRAVRLVSQGASAVDVRRNLPIRGAPFGSTESNGPQIGESPAPIGAFGLDRVRPVRSPPDDRPPPSNGPR